jgi:hypothetical protein
MDFPLPDVGRDGAVGGGVAARAAAGRSSTEGVERVGGAGIATGGRDAAAGRSIGAGAGGGGGVGDERTTLPVERTTAGFAGGASGSPTAGATWMTGATAGAAGSGGAGVGSGSASTTGSRLSPRESARRRTRSADGSSMLEE